MTFRETMACVDGALGFSAADAQERRRRWCDDHLVDGRESAERAGWRFEGRRVRYRWPYGWATAFVGRRVEGRDRLR